MTTPKIFCFVNGGSPGWYNVQALSEDGCFLAGHLCSHPDFGPHDMGVRGSNWKHDVYNRHYPQGWEAVWIAGDPLESPEIKAAHARHLEYSEEAYKARMACHKDIDSQPRVEIAFTKKDV